MASKNIKGITVEIGGNVTPLEKALKSVDASTKNLKSELGQINRLLKFDPKNATLLKQKYDVLEEQIKQTSEKLKTLKEAEKQAQSQFERGEISQEQYRGLQREVEQTTQDLKRYEKQLDDVENEIKNVDTATENAEQSTKKMASESEKAGNKQKDTWGTLTTGINSAINIAQQIVGVFQQAWDWGAKVGDKITEITKGFAAKADSFATDAKKYGVSNETVQKWKYAEELIDVSAETIGKSFGRLTKAIKNYEKGNEDASKAFEALGVATKNQDGTFRNTEQIFYDVIDALGKVEDETQADIYANTLFGKSFQELNPLIDEGSASIIELGDEADKLGLIMSDEQIENLNAADDAFQKLQSSLGMALLPIAEALAPILEKISKWLTEKLADPSVQKVLEAIGTALADILDSIGKIIKQAWDSGKIQSFLSTLSEKLPIIIDKIGDLIGKLAGADGSSLLDAFLAVADLVGNVVQNINDYIDYMADLGQSMIDSFQPVIKTVQNVIDYMKKLFEWLGKVKGKMFKLDSGLLSIFSGSGKNRRFAKGGIVTSPTNAIIGEAGSEAVIPLARLSGIMAAAMEKVGGNVVNGGNTYVMNVYPQDMTAGQQQALFNKFNRFIGQANGRSTI